MNAVNLRATARSGRTIIDHLRGYWEREGFDERLKLALEANPMFNAMRQLIRTVFQHIATLPPSVGYEPLLIERGANPLAARVMAHLTVHRGRRVARESRRRPAVVEAIRFLAEPGRQGAAISRRAQILLAAWDETSIIETIFVDAGAHELEFIELLKNFTKGDKLARRRITEIAADLAPLLKQKRGPKLSAASAAHEYWLEIVAGIAKPRSNTYSDYERDFTDLLTRATRAEFGDDRFDPRPAYREFRKRRQKAN